MPSVDVGAEQEPCPAAVRGEEMARPASMAAAWRRHCSPSSMYGGAVHHLLQQQGSNALHPPIPPQRRQRRFLARAHSLVANRRKEKDGGAGST